jgi:hypothetical protein
MTGKSEVNAKLTRVLSRFHARRQAEPGGGVTSVGIDLLRAAKETYRRELMLSDGLSSEALEKAIAAAMDAHEKAVLSRVATEAESFAMGMEADEDQSTDYITALRWFADKLRTDFGIVAQPYVPNDDDVVEVTITGSVITWKDDCDNPECDHSRYQWSVVDDATGDEYFFRTQPGRVPSVHVLLRDDTPA